MDLIVPQHKICLTFQILFIKTRWLKICQGLKCRNSQYEELEGIYENNDINNNKNNSKHSSAKV